MQKYKDDVDVVNVVVDVVVFDVADVVVFDVADVVMLLIMLMCLSMN